MSILKLPPPGLERSAADPQTAAGSATPETPFATVLHDERSRAQGAATDRAPERDAHESRRADAEHGIAEPDGTTASRDAADGPAVDPAALAALLGEVPVATATPAELVETTIPPSGPSPAVTPATGDAAPVPGAPATMPAATVATPAVASAAAVGVPAPPATAAGAPDEPIAAPGGTDANPQSVAPSAAPVPDGAPSGMVPDAPQGEASTSSLSAQQSSAPAAQGDANGPAPAAAAPAAPAAAPAPQAPPAMPGAPAPLDAGTSVSSTSLPLSRAAGLDRAVETVRLALRAAADRGVAHARISLSPRELGGIEIHLRHTAEGLVARVVAEHGGAAQMLQHAGAELRRALESQGLTVLQLDIGASGDQAGRSAGEQRGFGEAPARRDRDGAGRTAAGDSLLAPGDDGTPAPADTLALSNGVLVDVLA